MKLNGDLIMDEQKEQNNIRNKKSLIECRGVDVFYGDKQALFVVETVELPAVVTLRNPNSPS